MDLQSPEIIATQLADRFPEDSIHWRAQSVTKQSPYKALALAYIDSRHVQDRLDAVLGISGWQCVYDVSMTGKLSCGIGIKFEDEWIWKWDGAGDTDIEADKGAYSDAFKRAGVKWGIGRYLYDMPALWIPCEVNNNGKFKKFTQDPWKNIPRQPTPEAFPKNFTRATKFWLDALINGISYKGVKFEDLPESVCEQIANSSLEGVSESRAQAITFANEEWAIRVDENLPTEAS